MGKDDPRITRNPQGKNEITGLLASYTKVNSIQFKNLHSEKRN